MKKKVLTVTIVAAIVAALMFVLTGCPTPPPAPTDTVAPTMVGSPTITAAATNPVSVTVSVHATDNVGVMTLCGTLTVETSPVTVVATSTSVEGTDVTKSLIFSTEATISADTTATVVVKAIDAAGNASPEKSAATTLTF